MFAIVRTLPTIPSSYMRTRCLQTGITSDLNVPALDKWIASAKGLTLRDTLRQEHLNDLYITLPTRDGVRRPYIEPLNGSPLGYGHHLVFFHPHNPEYMLHKDGTDADFGPPEPFTRRMWAGGTIRWNLDNPLLVGENATANWRIESVEKKGFDKDKPMVFVNQKIDIRKDGQSEVSIEEMRSHVYLLQTAGGSTGSREVRDIPSKPDFSLEYTPSGTTLFRFSALTFNGHHIHLDKDYAQKSEGYPERLVHGPLTALMLLETLAFHVPGIKMRSFEYRARNPIIVNRPVVIHGAQTEKTVEMWCIDKQTSVVGMTGRVQLA